MGAIFKGDSAVANIQLENSIIAILYPQGGIAGTGFLVGPRLALTCAHVVQMAGGKPGGSLTVRFHANGVTTTATVDPAAWSEVEQADTALLRLNGDPPGSAVTLALGRSAGLTKRPFRAFGYPRTEVDFKELGVVKVGGVWGIGLAAGPTKDSLGRELLQLNCGELAPGHSGAPVLDEASGLVIGMVEITYPHGASRQQALNHAIPSEAIAGVCGLPLQAAPGPVTYPLPLPPKDSLPEPGELPPGSRPPPFARNAFFTGRQAELRALAGALLSAHPGAGIAVTQPATVAHGAGGAGKTQLAAEFAFRWGRFFAAVHWLNAGADLAAEIAACGLEMGLDPWPDDLPGQETRTRAAWAADPRPRLLALDNLEDLNLLQAWLARLRVGGCRLLVTSRRAEWPADLGLAALPLESLPRPESLALLRRLAPRLEGEADTSLGRLAERLGDLPLALDLAGRYLARRPRLSLDGYLKALDEAGLGHASLDAAGGYNPTAHLSSLTATFALSYARLEDESARRAFAVLGWCAANTAVPWELLQACLGEAGDPEGAVQGLAELGLARPGEAGPSLHPLLAEFARREDKEQAGLQALAEALGGLSKAALDTGLPEKMSPLRPHLAQAAGHAEAAGLERAGALWNNLGYHLKMIADYPAARAAYERALRIDEAVFGPDHPAVATDVNNLGGVLKALGELPAARAAYERALAIWVKVYGEEHPQVATAHNNLGGVLKDLGELPAARAAYERALRIDEAVFGPDHPNVARDVNNLGSVLQDLGELPAARAAFERVLESLAKTLPPEHPYVAATHNNLGGVLRDLGELPAARAAFERALRIDEAVFGPEHPDVARDVNNLGSVLQALGELPAARAAYERALRIDEAVFGPDHPKVAIRVNNLGSVLQDLGELPAARAAFERVLEILAKTLPPEHPYVATTHNNLGSVLQDLGELPAARAAFERALRIDEAVFGPEHPEVATDVNNLGLVLKDLGELPAARAAYERALAIFEKFLPPNHPNIRIVRGNLGSLPSP
jgi:tetratricopeptide (TPR) repeat protein